MKPSRHGRIHLSLQPRDVELLRLLLSRFGLLTRQQICQLFPERGLRRTNRRLRLLITAGYLSRRSPTGYLIQRVPIYGLGPKAFEALNLDPRDSALVARRKQAAHLADRALPHFILTNAAHIKFLATEREDPDFKLITWIPGYDSLWNHLAEYDFPLRPDAYLEYQKDGLVFPSFLELDRGTERAPRLHEKLAAYDEYATGGGFTAQFGRERFRVLFIAPTARRRDTLLAAVARYQLDLFWIATFDDFSTHHLFNSLWRSSASERFLSLSAPV